MLKYIFHGVCKWLNLYIRKDLLFSISIQEFLMGEGCCVAQSLVFCVMSCRHCLSFALFLLAIVFCLSFASHSDYPFSIIKLFLRVRDKILKLFGFSIFWLWVYLTKVTVIPEACCANPLKKGRTDSWTLSYALPLTKSIENSDI